MRKNPDHLDIYQMVSIYNLQRTKTEPLNIKRTNNPIKNGAWNSTEFSKEER